MLIQNILLASESYTFDNWVFRDICVGFSRLYYIIDGTGYYEENGQRIRLKKNHIYLTPVKTCFSLYDDPKDKLLHTYCHVITLPAVNHLIEIEVMKNSPLEDAVSLWRKYIHTKDTQLLSDVIQLLLSLIDRHSHHETPIAKQTKTYLDSIRNGVPNMEQLCRQLGYTREHITRCFASAYRVTPMQYLHIRRMNLALQRLIDGEGVGEVALALGYATPYAFSKAFKNHFGQSPKYYIQALRENHIPPC